MTDPEPIYHKRLAPLRAADLLARLGDVNRDWWQCPECGEELDYTQAHDAYTEGFAPEARPDVWRCTNCGYDYAA